MCMQYNILIREKESTCFCNNVYISINILQKFWETKKIVLWQISGRQFYSIKKKKNLLKIVLKWKFRVLKYNLEELINMSQSKCKVCQINCSFLY